MFKRVTQVLGLSFAFVVGSVSVALAQATNPNEAVDEAALAIKNNLVTAFMDVLPYAAIVVGAFLIWKLGKRLVKSAG
jgi:hypothetical protein